MEKHAPRDEAGLDLSGLRVHDAAPERVERVRARCLAELARQRRDAQRLVEQRLRTTREHGLQPAGWRSWLEPAIALGVSALYLLAAVGNTVALFR